jgi:hypothetical protein
VRDSLSLSSSSASSSNTALTGSSSTPAANNASNNDETASTSSGSSSVDVASIDVMRRLDEVSLLNFVCIIQLLNCSHTDSGHTTHVYNANNTNNIAQQKYTTTITYGAAGSTDVL